jgi:hypothetical protein
MRCRLSWLTNGILVYESKLLTVLFCFFSNFLRRLVVALASTFVYGADQRSIKRTGLPRIFFQVFRILSFRSSAYFLSGLPRTFFQVFRILSFRPSESFFQVFRALSFRSSAYFLLGLPNLTSKSSAHFLSGLPRAFFQVFFRLFYFLLS